jgi:predicted nuclease of restriction endonuclease-like (RecB) superfamily
MSRIKDEKAKEFYIKKCITNGWSRGELEEEIKYDAYGKSQSQQNNFDKVLPPDKLALYCEQFTDEYH